MRSAQYAAHAFTPYVNTPFFPIQINRPGADCVLISGVNGLKEKETGEEKKTTTTELENLCQMLWGLPHPLNNPSSSFSIFLYLSVSVGLSLSLFSPSYSLGPFCLSHGCNYARVNKRDQRETSGIPVGAVGEEELTQSPRVTHMHTDDLQVQLIPSYILSLCLI